MVPVLIGGVKSEAPAPIVREYLQGVVARAYPRVSL